MNVTLGLENILFIVVFFLSVGWLNRFGSVQSVSDFRNRNQTEPDFFFNRLILFFLFGFFGYFFSGFLGLIGLSVFLLTPSIFK